MYFADWNNRCESLWMTIVAMLVSKGQFNISGRCCRKLLETLLSINKPPTRWSNRQVGFFRWCWSNGFQFERSFTGIRKMLERRTKTIVGDCSKPNSLYFDVESTYVFLILSSCCQHFLRFFAIKMSRPVTNHAGSALEFQIFPTCW